MAGHNLNSQHRAPEETETLVAQIKKLAKERDAVILAHYYVPDEIQDIADKVGDSFALARAAVDDPRKTIVFCGVTFMGESASILNPDKTILIPDEEASCPMALMVSSRDVAEMRKKYDDLAVVTYINSYADTKAISDICVTSSNAVNIVKQLPQKNIYMIPDRNLSSHVEANIPDKNIMPGFGYCHVHNSMTAKEVEEARTAHPKAEVLAHPECPPDVLAAADYVGSTKGIIDYAAESDRDSFIICTEAGVGYTLRKQNPDKEFFFVGSDHVCDNMKRLTLEKVRDCLINNAPVCKVEEETRSKALPSLEKMLELGAK